MVGLEQVRPNMCGGQMPRGPKVGTNEDLWTTLMCMHDDKDGR